MLVEAAARTDPTDELAARDRRAAPASPTSPSATDDRAARDLWRYREGHTEAINLLGAPHKLDVTLPADELAGFLFEVRAQVAAVAPDATVWLFGHAADGNIHVNVTGVAPDDERITDAVLRLRRATSRIDQRRARNRHRQARVALARAHTGGNRHVPSDKDRARSRPAYSIRTY